MVAIGVYTSMCVTPCRAEGVDEECSGRERGECDCGKCACYVQDTLLRTVSEQNTTNKMYLNFFTSLWGILLCSMESIGEYFVLLASKWEEGQANQPS